MLHRLYDILKRGKVLGGSSGQSCFDSPEGITLHFGTSAPSGAGFAPGCLFLNTSTGVVYRNSGSKTSATWANVGSGSTSSLDDGCALSDAGALDATLSFTEQTVSAPVLTIPDFAGVNDTFVFATLAQTLAGKTLTSPTINKAAILSVKDSDNSHQMGIACGANLSANRVLTITIPDAACALTLTGDLIRSGAHSLTLTTAGATDVTLPTTGTLVADVLTTQGDIEYRGAAVRTRLAAGTAGQVLITAGPGSNPYWGNVSMSSIVNNTLLDDAGAVNALLALTTQTVSQPTLTIPDFGGVSDTFVFATKSATLANKSLTAPAITGGTAIELTGFSLRSSGAAFDLVIATSAAYDADRTLTINIPTGANCALTLTGDLIRSGAHSLTLTTGGATNVTLPTTGTLATLAGAEALSSKTLDASNSWFVKTGGTDRGLKVDCSTIAGAFFTTLNVGNPLADRILTLPITTTTLVGHDTSNTLTNKTIDADGTGNVITNINANELDPITPGAATYAVRFTLAIPFTNLAAAGQDIFTDNAPFKFRVIDMHIVATSADGGTVALNKGKVGALGTAITNTFTPGADKAITRATSIDDAQHEIAQAGSLVLVGDAGGTVDGIAYIDCIRVD